MSNQQLALLGNPCDFSTVILRKLKWDSGSCFKDVHSRAYLQRMKCGLSFPLQDYVKVNGDNLRSTFKEPILVLSSFNYNSVIKHLPPAQKWTYLNFKRTKIWPKVFFFLLWLSSNKRPQSVILSSYMHVFVYDSENMCRTKWLENKFLMWAHASSAADLNTHSVENKHPTVKFGWGVAVLGQCQLAATTIDVVKTQFLTFHICFLT